MDERTGGVVHRFEDQLAWSNALSDEPIWIEFYRRVWPDLLMAVRVDGASQWQRWGVDRMVLRPNGAQITVDEKKRKEDYGDILLETHSVWHGEPSGNNKLGWTVDRSKRCDYVAYAIVPAAKCYLFPLDLLRRTFIRNGKHWRETYGVRFSNTEGRYRTRNIPVPWDALSNALSAEMKLTWGAEEIALPPVTTNGPQYEFNWGDTT